MSEFKINLDRAVNNPITYPIGVKETITYTFNNIVTLSDTYQILISSSKNDRTAWQTIAEGADLSRATNVLTWNIHFAHTDIQERKYYYEIRNVTNDQIEFKGDFIAIKTIKTA